MRFKHKQVVCEITSLPGSSQVCVFHDVFLIPHLRGNGFGSDAHILRLEEAKNLGYQLAVCTVSSLNVKERKILLKNGWGLNNTFLSNKTGNTVEFWSKVL